MRRPGRAVTALAAALIALLVAAPAAPAHATLEGSSPARGAVVEEPPAAIALRFNEPVEATFGAVRIFDAGGDEVDVGEAGHPDGDGERLSVPLPDGLGDGSYTVTYRVVSADGHVVSGGYVFSVGRPGAAPAETVAELIGESGAGGVATAGLVVARAVQYAALGVGLGLIAFLLFVWPPARRSIDGGEAGGEAAARLAGRSRTILLLAAGAGLLSAAAAIVLHAADAARIGVGSALDPTILGEELGTRFGTVWGLTALAWALIALLLAPPSRELGRARLAPLLVPLALVALEPALSGHPGTQSPRLVLFAANVVHVLSMSVWIGGLAALTLALPAATRALEPPARTRLLAGALAGFSPLALGAVAALLATGILQSLFLLEAPADLLDTAYGRAVLAKAAILILLLIPLGAHNRLRSLPRLRRIAAGGGSPGEAGIVVRRALRAELALLAAVLVVTGILAGSSPPTALTGGPFSGSAELGPAQLEVTVDPAQVGSNGVHLYLFDAVDGSQYTDIDEFRADLSLPDEEIGPIELDLTRAGPGHYVAQGAVLTEPGDWDLEVAMRISEFDEYTAELEVPVR